MSDAELIKTAENWTGDKVTLRPSSVAAYFNCPRKWFMTFIGGVPSGTGGRAAIGTSIHAAIEQEWKEAIVTGQKDFNVTAMADRAEAELVELDLTEGIDFDLGQNLTTAKAEAANGARAFAEDIVPFTPIPLAVEERYTIELDNPVIENLSGTVDYIAEDTIADVKTSKRKISAQSHTVQQTLYKILANANGCNVKHNLVQGVILKARPEGQILELTPNEAKSKHMVNTILETLETYSEQKVSPDLLFPGNPSYYLCSNKYCALYATCPFVQGDS